MAIYIGHFLDKYNKTTMFIIIYFKATSVISNFRNGVNESVAFLGRHGTLNGEFNIHRSVHRNSNQFQLIPDSSK
jgi:hypothetical protein